MDLKKNELIKRILGRYRSIDAGECPDDETMTYYLASGLSGDEQKRIETHLRTCDRCFAEIAYLAKQEVEFSNAKLTRTPNWVKEKLLGSGNQALTTPALTLRAWVSDIMDKIQGAFSVPSVRYSTIALVVIVALVAVYVGRTIPSVSVYSLDAGVYVSDAAVSGFAGPLPERRIQNYHVNISKGFLSSNLSIIPSPVEGASSVTLVVRNQEEKVVFDQSMAFVSGAHFKIPFSNLEKDVRYQGQIKAHLQNHKVFVCNFQFGIH
jgi:hypothetical protein